MTDEARQLRPEFVVWLNNVLRENNNAEDLERLHDECVNKNRDMEHQLRSRVQMVTNAAISIAEQGTTLTVPPTYYETVEQARVTTQYVKQSIQPYGRALFLIQQKENLVEAITRLKASIQLSSQISDATNTRTLDSIRNSLDGPDGACHPRLRLLLIQQIDKQMNELQTRAASGLISSTLNGDTDLLFDLCEQFGPFTPVEIYNFVVESQLDQLARYAAMLTGTGAKSGPPVQHEGFMRFLDVPREPLLLPADSQQRICRIQETAVSIGRMMHSYITIRKSIIEMTQKNGALPPELSYIDDRLASLYVTTLHYCADSLSQMFDAAVEQRHEMQISRISAGSDLFPPAISALTAIIPITQVAAALLGCAVSTDRHSASCETVVSSWTRVASHAGRYLAATACDIQAPDDYEDTDQMISLVELTRLPDPFSVSRNELSLEHPAVNVSTFQELLGKPLVAGVFEAIKSGSDFSSLLIRGEATQVWSSVSTKQYFVPVDAFSLMRRMAQTAWLHCTFSSPICRNTSACLLDLLALRAWVPVQLTVKSLRLPIRGDDDVLRQYSRAFRKSLPADLDIVALSPRGDGPRDEREAFSCIVSELVLAYRDIDDVPFSPRAQFLSPSATPPTPQGNSIGFLQKVVTALLSAEFAQMLAKRFQIATEKLLYQKWSQQHLRILITLSTKIAGILVCRPTQLAALIADEPSYKDLNSLADSFLNELDSSAALWTSQLVPISEVLAIASCDRTISGQRVKEMLYQGVCYALLLALSDAYSNILSRSFSANTITMAISALNHEAESALIPTTKAFLDDNLHEKILRPLSEFMSGLFETTPGGLREWAKRCISSGCPRQSVLRMCEHSRYCLSHQKKERVAILQAITQDNTGLDQS